MWPFRQQKSVYELGDDVPTVINELKTRKHWKNLPPASIQQFGTNAAYVFDRPGEAVDALNRLVLILESGFFPGRLKQIANAADWRYEVSVFSAHLQQLASYHEQSVNSSRTSGEQRGGLAVADSAAVSQLVCERYDLCAYTVLARIGLNFGKNEQEAALWCNRYRKAESDLLSEDESRGSFRTFLAQSSNKRAWQSCGRGTSRTRIA